MKRIKWMSAVLAMLLLVSLLAAGCGNAGATGGSGATTTAAAKWTKNVEVHVPAAAGGGTDVFARALAGEVAQISGSNLTIVNNASGGGVVVFETVRSGGADGGKISTFHTSMLIASATGLYEKKLTEDFTLIKAFESQTDGDYVLLVKEESKYKTVDDLISAAKASPGKVIIGIQTGGMTHLTCGLFQKDAGVTFNLAEAGPDTEKLTSLVGGSIDAALVNVNQARQYVQDKKARALACVSKSAQGGRSEAFPDVKSLAEMGYKNTYFNSLMFVFGPKDLNPELAKLIGKYYEDALATDKVKTLLGNANMKYNALDNAKALEILRTMQTSINQTVKDLGIERKT